MGGASASRRQRCDGDNGLVSGARPRSRLLPAPDQRRDTSATEIPTPHGPGTGRRSAATPRRLGSRSCGDDVEVHLGEPEHRLRRRRPTSASSDAAGPLVRRTSVRTASGCSGTRQRQGGNGRSDAVRLLARGTLRRVTASRGGHRGPYRFRLRLEPEEREGSETRRTPRPKAGRNKPAGPDAEQTVEVVKVHADGTRAGIGISWPEGSGSLRRFVFREWTQQGARRRGASGQGHERRNRSRLVSIEKSRETFGSPGGDVPAESRAL